MSTQMPEWASSAAMVPNSRHSIVVDGTPTNYLAWGDPARPPVVLVHGTAAHAEWWRFVAPLLLPDYYVLALDLAGMGDSGHRDRYPREYFVQQVVAVARSAGNGRRPVIVGHSLGGFLTIQAGHACGEELGGIVVIDSPIHPPGSEPERAWKKRAETPNTVCATREEATARFRLTPDQPCRNRFYLEHIASHSVREVEGGWAWKFDPQAFAMLQRRSYVEELLTMRCPVALFQGSESKLFTQEVREYMRETFGRRYPIVEIADAFHHVLLDQPIALAAALRAQLGNWQCATQKN